MTKERRPTIDGVQKELRAQVAARRDLLARGGAKTIEEYQNIVGVIAGLTTADNLITDLLESMSNEGFDIDS